jgi:hypothetical protein
VKKFFVFAIALLVLGFAASSFAMQAEIPADTTAAIAKGGTQVTIGGEIRMRAVTAQNTGDFNRNNANGSTYGSADRQIYDYRVRLSVEAKMSPNTIGFIQMEAGGADSESNTGENTRFGDEGCKGLGGTFKCGDVKGNSFRVLQAWIQHTGSGLFGVPAYIKVGHQPIVIGQGVFYSHNIYNDDAIIAGITPVKGLDLSAVTVKLQENLQNSADDQTLYSGILSYAFNKDISAGVDVSFLQSQNGSVGTTSNTTGGTFNVVPGAAGVKADLWNIGANIKAMVSGFKLYVTGDFQMGQANITGTKYPFRGYALTGGAAYTFAPVTLALDLGYGSGDSKSDKKFSTFMTSQADTPRYAFVYDYFVISSTGNKDSGVSNVFFAKAGARADVMKNVMVGGDLILLRAAKKAYGGGSIAASNDAGIPTTSSNIGTEVDFYINYQIDKGLLFYVEGGYLFAGNFWKSATNQTKISDPWVVRPGLKLNF